MICGITASISGPVKSGRPVRYGAQIAKAVTKTPSPGFFTTDHAGAGTPTGGIPALVVDGKLEKGGESAVMENPPPVAKVPDGHTAVDKAAEAFPATT